MAKKSGEVTLAEASNRYLATLSNPARQQARADLSRFVRWYGAERLMGEIRPADMDSFVESLGTTLTDPMRRLEPVRALLAYAKKVGLTSTNLGLHLRLRGASSKKAVPEKGVASELIYFTEDGLRQLQADLATLKGLRPEVAQELRHAMADKDFRENAPLDAARERQGQLEARIRQLEATLKVATVVERDSGGSAKVRLASTITLRDLDSQQDVSYTLVNPGEVDTLAGKISVASPTGKALVEREAGDIVEVAAPVGKIRYRIEKVW